MKEKETKTLSEYIRETRENAGFSLQGLAKRSAIPLEQLEDIEAGKDLFLPATTRQKLAKALKINPSDIKEYERIMLDVYDNISPDYIGSVKKAIMEGNTENLRCPVCGSKLETKIVKLEDLEGKIASHAKAHCVKCSFQVK